MKKFFITLLSAVICVVSALTMSACADPNTIYVATNVPFAPFEYYDNNKNIVGVDVDIMSLVGEKLDKKVKFQSIDFDYIIDSVASGKKYDCGAAGITITPERLELVDFSDTYFTSIQYVIYKEGEFSAEEIKEDGDGVSYVLWSALEGKSIGVQRATTGSLYVDDEISGGVLEGTNASLTEYDDVMVATSALNSNSVNVVVIDKLPAEYVVNNSTDNAYKCVALYYEGEDGEADEPTSEDYAICVTKGNTELLTAINEVIATLKANGGIDELVAQHLNLN